MEGGCFFLQILIGIIGSLEVALGLSEGDTERGDNATLARLPFDEG